MTILRWKQQPESWGLCWVCFYRDVHLMIKANEPRIIYVGGSRKYSIDNLDLVIKDIDTERTYKRLHTR